MRSFACLVVAVLLAAVQLVTAAENATQPPNCGVSYMTPRHVDSTSTKTATRLTEDVIAQMHRYFGLILELLNPGYGLYLF